MFYKRKYNESFMDNRSKVQEHFTENDTPKCAALQGAKPFIKYFEVSRFPVKHASTASSEKFQTCDSSTESSIKPCPENISQLQLEMRIKPTWGRVHFDDRQPEIIKNTITKSADVLNIDRYPIDFLGAKSVFCRSPEVQPPINYLGKIWQPPPEEPYDFPKPREPYKVLLNGDIRKEHKWKPRVSEPQYLYETKKFTPESSPENIDVDRSGNGIDSEISHQDNTLGGTASYRKLDFTSITERLKRLLNTSESEKHSSKCSAKFSLFASYSVQEESAGQTYSNKTTSLPERSKNVRQSKDLEPNEFSENKSISNSLKNEGSMHDVKTDPRKKEQAAKNNICSMSYHLPIHYHNSISQDTRKRDDVIFVRNRVKKIVDMLQPPINQKALPKLYFGDLENCAFILSEGGPNSENDFTSQPISDNVIDNEQAKILDDNARTNNARVNEPNIK